MDRSLREGDWFAVPLRDQGYAAGVLARAGKRGVAFGYFFGPRRSEMPRVTDLRDLGPAHAVLAVRFGDLGLIRGEWAVLGHAERWRRDLWPMPMFVSIDPLVGQRSLVKYSDDDPAAVASIVKLSDGASSYERDAVLGHGAVELLLTQRLSLQ